MRSRLVALGACLFPVILCAQEYSLNTAKGFNANGVYQMNGIDNINAYNGNLTLTIPIGQQYSIGGGLSYQLRLHYNPNIWDVEEEDICEYDPVYQQDVCHPEGPFRVAYPDRRSNAGLGWTLTLGRLYPYGQITNESPWWIYESPDAAEHHFFPTLHEDASEQPGVAGFEYTRDGTYLRMGPIDLVPDPENPGQTLQRRAIEFPDGQKHVFQEREDGQAWEVVEIFNFDEANKLTITYSPDVWTLSDGFRQHAVRFTSHLVNGGPQFLVSEIEVATFDGTTAKYKFSYAQQTLSRPMEDHTLPPQYGSVQTDVKVLTKITLPDGTPATDADNLFYEFAYHDVTDRIGKDGLARVLTLPTGGRIEWDWQNYDFPQYSGALYTGTKPMGVWLRSTYDRGAATPLGTWTYETEMDPPTGIDWHPHELKNTITDPLGNVTESYFSIATFDEGAWDRKEYGLPVTKFTADPSGTRWLSQRVYGPGTLARSTFVRYEHDTTGTFNGVPAVKVNDTQNRRVVSTRTVYGDDASHFVETDNAEFDGYGHYRTSTSKSTYTGSIERISRTEYQPAGTYPGSFTMLPTNAPWRPGKFTATTVTEGDTVLRAEYEFDERPFLKRKRLLTNTRRVDQSGSVLTLQQARSANDVIVVYTPDARGNLGSEEYYGGDVQTVPTGDLSSLTLTGAPSYRLFHGYTYGAGSSTKYVDQFAGDILQVFDATIDVSTALPSSGRDTAGVETTQTYDVLGRLAEVRPAGRAWTEYVYDTAFPLSVAVKVRPAGTTTATTPLTEQRYYYDGLGRLTQQKDAIPHNDEIPNSDWAARNTEYDALDRVLKAFEPVPTSSAAHEPTLTSSAFTAYTYDPFGRVRTTTAPDGAQTTISYVGSRVKTIQSFLATPTNPNASVTTTERYDGAGRLIAVEQPTGPTTAASPTGATVKTEYRYDPANRLIAVAMRGAEGPVQQRLFDYDGRGFLRWESQPESGLTSYTYDARGHVRSKQQSAADTPFDLDFTYDGAERLLQVHGRNPFASVAGEPGTRILKLFEYGDANITSGGVTDRRKGKLVAATRFNYSDVAPPYLPGHPSQRDLAVKDTYFYKDAAGRRTDRITTISTTDQLRYDYPVVLREIATSISYNDLDLPQNVKYPMCVGCGGPESDPERLGMLYGYEKGRLTSITGFVNDISYWPNGLRNVLVHSNLIADTQQVSNMPRPSEISFGIYDRCVPPAIVTQPTSQTLTGSSTTLSVTMSGTGPFHYTWYDDAGGQIGTTQSVTVSPTVTTRYFVEVSTPCGILTSDDAIVSVGECPLPELGTVRAIAQPDGSWILGPDHPIGEYPSAGIDGPSVQYEWRKLPSSTVVGTQRALAVSSVTATTTWSLTVIVQNCGTDTANITIDVPPAMPTNLAAIYLPSPTRISIAWTAIPGATYQVERRSGPVWQAIGTSSSGTFLDQTVAAPQTYAYRVKIGDRYSNADVATTTSFTPVVVGQIPNAAHAESLRNAVNYVRGAAGWPALSWSAMLPASDFLPSPGNKISARHVESCRARINEALQALGVPLQSYTTPFLSGAAIQAVHFNEIQDRAK